MMAVTVRATYESDGWGVVVVTPAADGHAPRGLVARVDAPLQIAAEELWTAIVAAAQRAGIALPAISGVAPTSPGAGVRAWHLPSAR